MGRQPKMGYFIDNEEFEREIETFRELGHPESCRLGQILTDLHLGIIRSLAFKDYQQDLKQKMVEYSMYHILRTRFSTWDR